MEKYDLLCQIGKGACGAVYLVRCKENKKLFALKKIQLDETRKTRTKEAVLREARILADLKHTHIVAYHGSFFDTDEVHLCIIQDYCDGGTLDDKIKEARQKAQYFPEKQILHWFLQIALAVRYMHSKRVLHRDLKTQNVFLNKSGTICKLGDFGIAKAMDTAIDVASTCVGTPCYLSPEMCQDIPYSSKADVWALGCMLYEIVALKPAFDAFNLVSLFYKIVKGEYDNIPDCFTPELSNLIASILVKSPEERPSARGVLLLPLLKEELKNFIEEKDFILKTQTLPARDGSRPYSTPVLSRVGLMSSDSLPAEDDTPQKRAISCRPSMGVTGLNKDHVLSSAKAGRSGRVSTIPEETEEQLLERSLRIAADNNKAQKEADRKKQKTPSGDKSRPKSQSETPSGESMELQTVSKNGSKADKLKANKATTKEDINSNEIEKDKCSGESGNSDNMRSDKTSDCSNIISPRIDSNDAPPHKEKRPSKLELKQDNSSKSEAPQKPLCVDESPKSSKNEASMPSAVSNIGVKPDFSEIEPPKRHKIQEPQRTPRIHEPNALIIQFEAPKQTNSKTKETNKPPANQTPAEKPPSNSSSQKKSLTLNKGSSKRSSEHRDSVRRSGKASTKSSQRSGTSKDTRPETRDSLLSVPYEPTEYYSDDFDDDADTLTDSDIDDDIPEELSYDYRRSAKSYSYTQTFEVDLDLDVEIPEIEEDLDDGEADDDDDFMGDNDMQVEEEELGNIVNEARRAHDDLESSMDKDEVIVDDRRPNTSKFIRNHCIDALGKEKYDKVQKYVENNDAPELKKLERLVGKEHAKTVFLMAEISRKPRNK